MKQNLLKISEDIPQTSKLPHSALKQKKVKTQSKFMRVSKLETPQLMLLSMPSQLVEITSKHGNHTYLLTKDLRNKIAKTQRQSSGNPEAPLLAQSNYSVSRFQSTALEEILIESDPRFQPPAQWRKRSIALRNLSSLKKPSPQDGLENILRPYQTTGTAWMLHLFDHGLGGILADEMGLGKTLQTLAFLSCLRKRGGPAKTSLVICPASLVENWKRKLRNFAHLSPFILTMVPTEQLSPLTLGNSIL